MFTLKGDWGSAIFEGNTGENGQKTSNTNYLTLDTKASLNFFRRISVLKTNIALNSLGLYSFGRMGRNGEVRFANLRAPKHLLKPRQSGCAWNPKGSIDMQSRSFDVEAIEYQGEQCPDTFYETCFERIYGTGREVKDLMATPEGLAIVNEITALVYEGLGNSFYDLVTYAQHPLIDDADANDWFTVDDKEWSDFKEQQATRKVAGHLTIIDKLAEDQGYRNLNVEIARSEISLDGKTFIGDAPNLFSRVLEAQSPEMKIAAKRSGLDGILGKSIILASPSIFAAYEKELVDEYANGIPERLFYTMNANFARALNMAQATFQEGILKYKGHVVVCMDEWGAFDTMTGTVTHRVIAATPGVLGIGWDVADIAQFRGMGMRMVQKLDAPDNGKIYMDTNFDVGMGLINENFIVNASRTFTPAA